MRSGSSGGGDGLYQVLTPPCPCPSPWAPTPTSASVATQEEGKAGDSNAASSTPSPSPWRGAWTTSVLLFRPHPTRCPVPAFRDDALGASRCIAAIKRTGRVYVSPTTWDGQGAIRLAVSNWRTGLERRRPGGREGEGMEAQYEEAQTIEESEDWRVTVEVLREVMQVGEAAQ